MIKNPDSNGQGEDYEFPDHPYYPTVVKFGYRYAYSTDVTNPDGSITTHHTHKLADHTVTLFGDLWSTQISATSGRRTVGAGEDRLRAHLRNKRRRYPELRVKPGTPFCRTDHPIYSSPPGIIFLSKPLAKTDWKPRSLT